MNCFLLNVLNAKLLEFLIEDLAQIHHDAFVNLLPQVGAEDLDQGDLECRDLSVQEDASKIELNLEADVYIGPVGRQSQ